MQIHDFKYFDNQQVTSLRSTIDRTTHQDFDLDLHTMNRHSQQNDPLQGSGHPWCSLTNCCVISLAVCPEK